MRPQPLRATTVPPDRAPIRPPSPTDILAVLGQVFVRFDAAGLRYAVVSDLSGGLPHGRDLDIVAPGTADQFARVLVEAPVAGVAVVELDRGTFTIAVRTGPARYRFVPVDVASDLVADGLTLAPGEAVLGARVRRGPFWAAAPEHAFVATLAKAVLRGAFAEPAARLSRLFAEAPTRCAALIAEHWQEPARATLLAAAAAGRWGALASEVEVLRRGLATRGPFGAVRAAPGIARRPAGRLARAARRLIRPQGVYIAALGPDGAGKSTLLDRLGPALAELLPRTAAFGFTPEWLHRLRHGPYRQNPAPHGAPPRSALQSVVRALGYWYPYYVLGWVGRRLRASRPALVTADRFFDDVLVDPVRYRYGGPLGLVAALARAVPQPDLLFVLDAPAEVIQRRKQEVSPAETARQARAYRALARHRPNRVVLDAGRPADAVLDEALQAIVALLAARVRRRLGVTPVSTDPNRTQPGGRP